MWVRSLIAVWLSVLSLGAPADECLPSEWGAADQIGAANRITPERTIAAAALVRAVQAEAKAHGWGVVRWITRDHNYRARGLYDKLAEKTDWALYEMTAI